MNLAYMITRTQAGGAQVHLLDLVTGFRRAAAITVLAGSEDGEGHLGAALKGLGTRFEMLTRLRQPIRPAADLAAFFECRRILRRMRPDLLHCHSSKAGVIGRLAARALQIPTIFTAHGFAFSPGVPPARRLVALMMEALGGRVGDAIIAVSNYDKELAVRHHVASPDRIRVVHNGVPDVAERASPDRSPPKVIMVGRFARQKDQALLIRALAPLQGLPWECTFVGEGPTEVSCRALAKALGLDGRMHFLGTRGDVPRLLAEHQVLVLASNWEGLPLSVLEAMRAGLPVVASDVGGTREAVVDGETGYLVPRGDVEALKDRLERLLGDPDLRKRMGLAGRTRYERNFTVELMLRGTWEVYREVLGARGKQLPTWEELSRGRASVSQLC